MIDTHPGIAAVGKKIDPEFAFGDLVETLSTGSLL
jgi:hypothetical protein